MTDENEKPWWQRCRDGDMVSEFGTWQEHAGHVIEVTDYGSTVLVECDDCGQILLSLQDVGDAADEYYAAHPEEGPA